MPFAQPRNGAVIDDFAILIAPGRVHHLADAAFGNVARHHPVHQAQSLGTGDFVLIEGGNIDQPRRVAHSEVFDLVAWLVGDRGEVARPIAPFLGLAKWGSAAVKWAGDGHGLGRVDCTNGRGCSELYNLPLIENLATCEVRDLTQSGLDGI